MTAKIREQFEHSLGTVDELIDLHRVSASPREMGRISQVGRGVALVQGLARAQANELLLFPHDRLGYVFNLDPDSIGCVLLDSNQRFHVGDEVRRTSRVLDVPVGNELLGRVIDPVGRPLDGKGPLDILNRSPCEREAPAIMDRAAVHVPLQTGIKVIDALVPIGRGQRQLIVGDRQTGKTSVAVDTIINQQPDDVVCIYCSIGQRSSSVAGVIHNLQRHGALERCIVVVGEAESSPGLQFIAPYAATSMGEYFMEQGRDVLVIYDELTSHARAYREMSLLLRRPPGREAFPGDIFYIHARLLERATQLKEEEGGGSLTALPVIETEAQNISAYIPTNLISITDGQIYLSPDLFQKGILPAVDVGRSVSRVGGKAQLLAYRALTSPLRLAYAQFEELEKFARFSSQLDEATTQSLNRGQRVREVLKQEVHQTLSVSKQIAAFVAVTSGVLDSIPVKHIGSAEQKIQEDFVEELPALCERIEQGDRLSVVDIELIEQTARSSLAFPESQP